MDVHWMLLTIVGHSSPMLVVSVGCQCWLSVLVKLSLLAVVHPPDLHRLFSVAVIAEDDAVYVAL